MEIKHFFQIAFITIMTFAYGCDLGDDDKAERGLVTGTEGLTIEFLENQPLDKYVVGDVDEPIKITLEVRNKGSYPQENEENLLSLGQMHISGFDRNVITVEEKSKRLRREFLNGVSNLNQQGGFDSIEFEGFISAENIIVDKYDPTILATICYPYVTKASPTVCIDPFPFDEKQEKVCRIGSQTLSSQGAPIAVTRIDQEASSNKIQFKITLKNLGEGDVTRQDKIDNCNPYSTEELDRKDFDRVDLRRATVGFSELNCGPFDENNKIRLVNGEGFILCSLDRASFEDTSSAYTTPLNLEFRYGYRTTITKQIKISKISTIN